MLLALENDIKSTKRFDLRRLILEGEVVGRFRIDDFTKLSLTHRQRLGMRRI